MIATLFANAAEPWPLRAGVVHVWRFEFARGASELVAQLSEDERARAAGFVFAAIRDAFVVQRATVRMLLARYVGAAPRDLVFEYGARGKPRLTGARVEFNLSHAADIALLAVAEDVELGVDVERLDADIDARALGRIVLARDERAIAGERAGLEGDARGFLRVWCRKEACLKATGLGLIDDLTSVSVAADRVDVAGTTVHVQDLDIGADHAAALASSAPCAGGWLDHGPYR